MEGVSLADALERHLGDPEADGAVINFRRSAELDEAEAFPGEWLSPLYELGLAEVYIPPELGGKLRSYTELLHVSRALARRDLTLAVTSSTLVWSTVVWIAGTPAQRLRQAQFLRERKTYCLAYSEADHGSDLTASETVALKDGAGYRLRGEKWPINRATRGEGFIALAQTDARGGPLSLSLFLLEKDLLPPASFAALPRVKTLGVRGCDISGVALKDCPASAEDRLGAEGEGLSIALKGFQVTRALCSALSLGAADTGFRTTLNLVLARKLYGASVWEIPQVQRTLGLAFADLLLCEALSLSTMRILHVAPEQLSVWAIAAKYVVPTLVDDIFRDLSVLQGARFYMREHHDHGVFQKMFRDHVLIGIFDGSTVVNLNALTSQLRSLGRKAAAPPPSREAGTLPAMLDLNAPLPPADLTRLELTCRQGNELLERVPELAEQVPRLNPGARLSRDVRVGLALVAQRLTDDVDALHARVQHHAQQHGRAFSGSPELFELARRYCTLHTAAAGLGVWLSTREHADDFFARGEWLLLGLERLLGNKGELGPVLQGCAQASARELLRLHQAKRPFALSPKAP